MMTSYLACMKKVKGMNDPECRDLAKSYLSCRMERFVRTLRPKLQYKFTNVVLSRRNLMAKDEFKNLGFKEEKPVEDSKQDDGAQKGDKNELRW